MVYPPAQGTLPLRYSPFRRANDPPKGTFALDLHGLATPPAFVLSQDQTLQFISFSRPRRDDEFEEVSPGGPAAEATWPKLKILHI